MKSPEKLLVVIDTNILLVSVSSRSKYHWLYKTLIEGKFQLAVTQDILLEYEEIIGAHWSSKIAVNVIRSIAELPNVIFTPIYYQLNLIHEDVDDNKFVDCAFAANADYIITHDSHFNILKTISFPRIPVVKIPEFKKILESKQLI